jgi:hypothetical protein
MSGSRSGCHHEQMPFIRRWTHTIDNPVFDEALPTRMLANREAPGPMGAPVLISRDSIRNDLPRRMADFVAIFWTPAKHAVFDDIEFDDDLIAKMMANMASNGMSLAVLVG